MALAARVVAEIIGYAFIAALERGQRSSLSRAWTAWRWLAQIAEAPPGLELIAPDDSSYTGLVFLERSRAVLLLAIHHPASSGPRSERNDWLGSRPLGLFEDDDSNLGDG